MTKEDKKWGLIAAGIILMVIGAFYVNDYFHKKGVADYKAKIATDIEEASAREERAVNNLVKAYSGDVTMARTIELEKKYAIVEKAGDIKEMHDYAGKVATAYLEADDETSYLRWKETQKQLADQLDQ